MATEYENHPIAEHFPLMNKGEYARLRDSIKRNGLRFPITLYEGKVLDGRHRYQGCLDVGVEPRFTEFKGNAESALDYVIDANDVNRKQSKDQCAAIAAGMVTTSHGGDRTSPEQDEKIQLDITLAQSARKMDVNEKYVSQAFQVLKYDADLHDDVKRGDIALGKAYAAVKLAIAAREDAADAKRLADERAAADAAQRGDWLVREERAGDEQPAKPDHAGDEQPAKPDVKPIARPEPPVSAVSFLRQQAEDAARRAEKEAALTDSSLKAWREGEYKSPTSARLGIGRESLKRNPPPLPDGKYRTVVIDPPWPIQRLVRGDERPTQTEFGYPTMSVDEIRDMDIGKVLADDAYVFLWTTEKYLPAAFGVLDAWELKYRFTMAWDKIGGTQPWGMPMFNLEFVVVGAKGNPTFVDFTNFKVGFTAPRGGDSEKPDAFYDLLRRVTARPRLDMFNRRAIDGFEGWGDEADAT